MNPIPTEWLSQCSMKRIILHWTEGWREPNAVDLEHYHFLIAENRLSVARVARGDHSVADNVSTADDDYAAHTRGLNTGSIGVALCGMVGCEERPRKPGKNPYSQAQYNLMVKAVAQLCEFYKIPVTPQTVLAHGEVQAVLGVKQAGKWDPMYFPWAPLVDGKTVMDRMRAEIKLELEVMARG